MNTGAGGFWKYCVFLLTFSTACLITSFCLFLFYHSCSRISGTHKSVTQNDTGLHSFKWHSHLSGKSQKWDRENESCAVLPPTVALLRSSQSLLCNVVLIWQLPRASICWPQAQHCGDGLLQEASSGVRARAESSQSLECSSGTAGLTNVL